MSDQPIRTWTLSEVSPAALACWPSGTPESDEYARRYRTKTLIELEPVLDLLQRVNCNAIFAYDALGRRAATELVDILSEHGMLS